MPTRRDCSWDCGGGATSSRASETSTGRAQASLPALTAAPFDGNEMGRTTNAGRGRGSALATVSGALRRGVGAVPFPLMSTHDKERSIELHAGTPARRVHIGWCPDGDLLQRWNDGCSLGTWGKALAKSQAEGNLEHAQSAQAALD